MFPIYKLKELPENTRIRKIVAILKSLEIQINSLKTVDRKYISGIAGSLPNLFLKTDEYRKIETALSKGNDKELLRAVNALRHYIQKYLKIEPAEWDMLNYETGTLDKKKRTILPFYVYLEDIRSPYNVGAIFRTAEAFAVEKIYLSPRTPLPHHPRASKTARGADKIVPWETAKLKDILSGALENDIPVFALELGGTKIDSFKFPGKGIALIGSEELGLSPDGLKAADKSLGRVSIPMGGAKRSLNVSVAFGILMFYWLSKNT
ncbi:MAG: TrmH family RNA methyltransferase [Spirochaetales bacterium]|nr:TrmH family RNA methyltransferase [Spirochaetales bacterium]